MKYGGSQIVSGGNRLATGNSNDSNLRKTFAERLAEGNFCNSSIPMIDPTVTSASMAREVYQAMYGPTTGDKLRLGSTDLWVEIENDFTVYGDECTFGGGKTLREGMGQATGRPDMDCLDLVITNAVIIDWSGIYKADIGVKNGRIIGIGKAGNPDVMDGVHAGLIVGTGTDVICAENSIVTAGGVDSHVHFICPQQVDEAICSGITTMLGGGTGPRYMFIKA